MKISDLSISRKVGLLVLLMGIAAGTIATVGSRGLTSLGAALQDTGAREEVAREAMDLRVDVIAISRMTYQLAMAPEKAADFAAETEKRAAEMLDRLPKIASTADATEQKQLDAIRAALAPYFEDIRAMVAVAGSDKGQDRAALLAALDKALDGQKAVTAAIKEYSAYSADTLSGSRAVAISARRQRRSCCSQPLLSASSRACCSRCSLPATASCVRSSC